MSLVVINTCALYLVLGFTKLSYTVFFISRWIFNQVNFVLLSHAIHQLFRTFCLRLMEEKTSKSKLYFLINTNGTGGGG